MPEGAKACGNHLLVWHSGDEKAQTLGEVMQGGDGRFGDGRIIEWEVLLDQSRDHRGGIWGEPAAADDGCLLGLHLQGPLHAHNG